MQNDLITTKMKNKATKKYKDGRIIVLVDRENCEMFWIFKTDDGEIQSEGQMDIELYCDDTWLCYEETHRPTKWMPKVMQKTVYDLCRKCGMREDHWGNV